MNRATTVTTLFLVLAACDPGETTELEAQLANEGSPAEAIDASEVLEPEGPVEYPIDVVELSNGNVLEFYADPASGWSGVAESIMPDNPSVLDAFDDDVSALELFLLATDEDWELPEELLAASRFAALDVSGLLESTPRGGMDELELMHNPQASSPSWCTTVVDFLDAYCTDGGVYDAHACQFFWTLYPGGAGALTSGPAFGYQAAYCHLAGTSLTSLQYRNLYHGHATEPGYACEPTSIAWNTVWSGITDVSKNYHWGGGGLPREYRLSRYAFAFSQAHYGHKWAAEDCN